ncbi:hypothetical protein [Paludisphaera rhizosphaerae]|uniref:hypothetical protein n=1 Tax=Paludisphaera rhizosphaerae TaxID=2711216 RepID=UPI0013ECFF86|nr:hypothetical protein [Paludisphaera rhizosphaerae]
MSKTDMSGGLETCLVVSHYNAWPTDQLLALLDQTKEIPAGVPFRTRVVVNQAVDKRLELPPRHSDVEVFHRPNTGYNIGAWEYGWRQGEPFSFYLFLQEECIILKDDWMKAYLDAASETGVGLVGESMTPPISWKAGRLETMPICRFLLGRPVDSGATRKTRFFQLAQSLGVDPGEDGAHLQSLILGTRREVLTKIDGFLDWPVEYFDAVCAEVMISKAVETAGWKVRQLGWMPFSVVSHPQWKQHPLMALVGKVAWRIPVDIRFASYLVVCALRARTLRAGTKLLDLWSARTTSVSPRLVDSRGDAGRSGPTPPRIAGVKESPVQNEIALGS